MPPDYSLPEVGSRAAFDLARSLTTEELIEVWRVMEVLTSSGSTEGLSGPLVRLAVMFNGHPELRQFISELARE